MKMFYTYGVFDNEADHILRLVHQHASIEQVLAEPCPSCGSKIVIKFDEDGRGFQLHCHGDFLHTSKYERTEDPPPWWETFCEEPRDITCFWIGRHGIDPDETLVIDSCGTADGVEWTGYSKFANDHPDYQLWLWILNELGRTE